MSEQKLNQDQQKQIEAHNRATSAFIELANKLAKEEGQDVKVVSAALMAASGIYATFITAGNKGFLAPSGVDKIAEMYKNVNTNLKCPVFSEVRCPLSGGLKSHLLRFSS